jgi:predicted nucleic acid-binding protein
VILVDSSVWIEYFNGNENPHTDYLDGVLGVEPVGIGDLILAEVLQGFRSDADFKTAKSLLLELPICEIIGTNRAVKAAEHYRFLRSKGFTVRKTADTLIATFCIEQKYPLLFTDKDFVPFVRHLELKPAFPGT